MTFIVIFLGFFSYTMVGNTPEERKMFRITPMHYVVFDEAHMLKNMNTQRYENLMRIHVISIQKTNCYYR